MKSIFKTVFLLLLTLQLFRYDLQVSQAAPQNSNYSSSALAVGQDYYVDSISGSDANPGTSEGKPWKTLTPVHDHQFLPGDVVHFKRGSQWNGGFTVDNSGTEAAPIVFTDYGNSDAPPPTFSNSGQSYGVRIGYSYYRSSTKVNVGAEWVILENIRVMDVKVAGVLVYPESNHNIIRNIEVTGTGFGLQIQGQHNLTTQNYIHDLHTINDTPGGNDDYGAVGIEVEDSYNEISYNKIINCFGHSYDYGTDGGTVEIWVSQSVGSVVGTNIHHNWAANNNGFLEAGGQNCTGCNIPLVENTIVAYNVAANNGYGFISIHLVGSSAPYQVEMKNFRVENNTVVAIVSESDAVGWTIFRLNDGTPAKDSFLVYNNIFYLHRMTKVSNTSSFIHENNLYYLTGGTNIGLTLGNGEKVADPRFVNLAEKDFHLQSSSPAIDAGINLGYILDNDNNLVNKPPDLGAFEYQSNSEPTSTPTPNNNIPSLTLAGPTSAQTGQTFNINVVARNVPSPGLYGVQFELNYNPALVSTSNLQVNPNFSFVVLNSADNTAGKIRLAASQQGKVPGLSGNVTLLSFDARATNTSGVATFAFDDQKMSDFQAQGFNLTRQNYSVTIAGAGTPEPTAIPTETPTPQPTTTPTSQPTPTPTATPTNQPTPEPTAVPTQQPTPEPTIVPTDQPTPKPTSEPTVEPTSTPTTPTTIDLSGQIIMIGRANNDWSGSTVTIASSDPQATLTDVTGNFHLAGIPAGTHTLTADAPGYLSAVCTNVTVNASNILLNPVSLLSGDINDDNIIDITDATAVGAGFGQAGVGLPADITRDGRLDIFDIVLVSVNFGEEGPQTWNCMD